MGTLPFNFEKLKEYVEIEFDDEMQNLDKTVIIGDSLTRDIMFGNMNNMCTIWINRFC